MRKQTDKMSRAVNQLEHMFNKMNVDFFGGTLPTPIITVQSSPRAYGHCTVAKVWKKKDSETYELNIGAEVLNFPIEETLDTMGHEMVHLYCRENDIRECSRGGTYHNKKFKELAEKIGLDTFHDPKHGWNTKGGYRMLEYAIANEWSEITLGRSTRTRIQISIDTETGEVQETETEPTPVNTSSTRKYICPKCKQSIRATKDVNIICGDCLEKMIKC